MPTLTNEIVVESTVERNLPFIEVINKSIVSGVAKYYRDGIEIEKGVIYGTDRLEKNRSLFEKYANFWSVYPDLFLDLILPVESHFALTFYQRIFLRACMRYTEHYVTAPRGFAKSFTTMLAIYLLCIFRPGLKAFICAPGKEQGAKIGREKIEDIWNTWPLLKNEIKEENGKRGNFGKDYVKLNFLNGSVFDVVGALDTTRGGRRNCGLIDEVRDHDGDIINEVVLPLLVVERKMVSGVINPNEPQPCRFWMTSAGQKGTYAYEKLIEVFENSIIDPNSTFVWGCDYRLPVKEGILSRNYLQQMRLSPTFKEDSFARESMGIWTGGSDESWFDYDKLSKYRLLVNPEKHQKPVSNSDFFYLLSVDVGRISCQTVVTVFKCFKRSGTIFVSVVNIIVLGLTAETKHNERQAIDLKKLIAAFDPAEVVIDGNGLGVGLLDYMVKPSIDEFGSYYPAYCSFNDDVYDKRMYPDGKPIIYVLKAGTSLNSKIHANCYTYITSGRVKFLVKEQEIKNRLFSSEKGRKMKPEERIKRIMPHELTTKLFEEMSNLRIKRNAGLDINLEPISARTGHDKFSSLEYGLWRIKEIAEDYYTKQKRRDQRRKFMFFTEGGNMNG